MTAHHGKGHPVDGRSVGELLLDADLTSRAALWDTDPQLAKARVRTWGEVVEAATDLWSAIPDPDADPSMRRIQRLTQAVHRTQKRTQWPGPGPADPHLETIATSLARATQLVSARRHPTEPLSAAGRVDAEAARTRLVHVLYVAAHAAGVTLGAHCRDLQVRLDSRHSLAPGDSLRHARETKERLATIERLAGSFLQPRWPTALTGEHRDSAMLTRLNQALAHWDVQAHRSLAASPPTAANLHHIAHVQKDLTVATELISAAAARRGLLDPQQHTDRLGPSLASLERAWGTLASDLGPLLGRQRRLTPELLQAGNEVHAALRDITHRHAGFATPDVMAARVDLAATTATLHRGLAAAVDLAQVTRDALNDPQLHGSARGAHALATAGFGAQPLGAWVAAGDLHHNRYIALPHPVRATLTGHADEIVQRANVADSAAAAHQPTHTPREPATLDGRRLADRTPPASGTSVAPGMRCER